jgi:hypothetical protein
MEQDWSTANRMSTGGFSGISKPYVRGPVGGLSALVAHHQTARIVGVDRDLAPGRSDLDRRVHNLDSRALFWTEHNR